MTQLTVFTAIVNYGVDKLRPPTVPQSPGVKLVAYMSHGEEGMHGPWEVRRPAWQVPSDSRRLARRHKLQPHLLFPESEHTLWIDGSVQLTKDALTLLPHLGDRDICLFPHSQRNCIYQEGVACIRLAKDDPTVIQAQLAGYRAEQYPADNGLFEHGIILRRNTPMMTKLGEAWWAETLRHSLRDQLSLNYLLWRLKIPYAVFPGTVYKNDFTTFHPHNLKYRAKRART